MAHVKGLHETPGLQTTRVTGSKANPAKLTAKLARLDHQRALLDRQLAVWTEKQQVTRLRLGLLEKQMAQLSRLIRERIAPIRATKSRPRNAASDLPIDGASAAAPHRDMTVEY